VELRLGNAGCGQHGRRGGRGISARGDSACDVGREADALVWEASGDRAAGRVVGQAIGDWCRGGCVMITGGFVVGWPGEVVGRVVRVASGAAGPAGVGGGAGLAGTMPSAYEEDLVRIPEEMASGGSGAGFAVAGELQSAEK
jgi:hypothetical protein